MQDIYDRDISADNRGNPKWNIYEKPWLVTFGFKLTLKIEELFNVYRFCWMSGDFRKI